MASDSEVSELYDRDFMQWTLQQAAALRRAQTAGANLPLDWENLADEIESLGRSLRRELGSQIRRILRDLLKLEVSPAANPRAGWYATIREARADIEEVLAESPSLRREVDDLLRKQAGIAAELAAADLEEHGELTAAIRDQMRQANFTGDQVLGDWFPDIPA